MSLNFIIKDVKLNMYDTGKVEPFITFETKGIAFLFDKYPASFDCTVCLAGMYLRDYIYQHKDPSLAEFITSEEY